MILDASAVLAILLREEGSEALADRILDAETVGIGAPTLTEAAMVLIARLGPSAVGLLDRFLQEFQVEEIPFGSDHWRAAADAYIHFGKGRNPAGLNFGDCMSYAVAKLSGLPLLYVGNDFSRTDLA